MSLPGLVATSTTNQPFTPSAEITFCRCLSAPEADKAKRQLQQDAAAEPIIVAGGYEHRAKNQRFSGGTCKMKRIAQLIHTHFQVNIIAFVHRCEPGPVSVNCSRFSVLLPFLYP